MKIVFFTHPDFFNSRSMTIYMNMLTEGMRSRGHQVNVWKPKARFYNLPCPQSMKKWMGYIDQFVVFPFEIKRRLRSNGNSLFVFTDNALGPWVPFVKNYPHVVHCHDFLAQNSGIGIFAENQISWTGKKYQDFIRNGYKNAKSFISVSHKTRDDLHKILETEPELSEVVYNGINKRFKPLEYDAIREVLTKRYKIDLSNGFLLHVGGNLWYKNRKGVVEIYSAWRNISKQSLPLILVGEASDRELSQLIKDSKYKNDILIVGGIDDHSLHEFYAAASLFVFPSLEEGFGWPIAEAMACGCPVLTTGAAPMNEVGGKAAFYIPRRPIEEKPLDTWINESAIAVEEILDLPTLEKDKRVKSGLEYVEKFDLNLNLDRMEEIYKRIMASSK